MSGVRFKERPLEPSFDNRVQVIAAAGSGKTFTLVAKAGYALRRQIVAPERILLLAFNDDAAAELRMSMRTQDRKRF